MAGHLQVNKTIFRISLLHSAMDTLKNINKPFEKLNLTNFTNYKAMILPTNDYQMNDDHGLIDNKIIAVSREEDTLEYHLDVNDKINAIYLVM